MKDWLSSFGIFLVSMVIGMPVLIVSIIGGVKLAEWIFGIK